MSRRASVAAVLLMAALPVFAHRGDPAGPDPPAPVFKLEKLTDRAWCLFGQGGNVGFLVTDAGVIVVDDQYERLAPGIVDQIRTVTDRPIRYLINTHYHSDHTGGNPTFIRLAEIVAHDTVRPRLLEYPATIRRDFPGKVKALEAEVSALKDPSDPWRLTLEKDLALNRFMLEGAAASDPAAAAPPGLTYDGRVTLWLGGQEVRVFHVAPGHTDGDSIVFFVDQKVLHMGDLFFHGSVPFIDVEAGGSAKGYIESIEQAVSLVPPDTRVIAGHGPVGDIASLKRAGEFLRDLWAEVDKAVKAGMSKAYAVRAIRMGTYPDIKPGFRTLGNDISAMYDEIRSAGR